MFDDRLGSGTGMPDTTEEPVASPAFDGLAQLTAGAFYTCGIRPEGDVHCQGVDEAGVIGGEGAQRVVPMGATIEGTAGATTMGSAVVTACALIGGRISCWGGNAHGELATDSRNDCGGLHIFCRGTAAPVRDPMDRRFAALSSGVSEALCAVTTDGHAVCWGRNDRGQAGHASMGNVERLGAPVLGADEQPLTNVVEVATGTETSCARGAGGRLWCWGDDQIAKRGCGTFDDLPHATACEVTFPAP